MEDHPMVLVPVTFPVVKTPPSWILPGLLHVLELAHLILA